MFICTSTLQNDLKKQTKTVKYCFESKYKTTVTFCRQSDHISHKRLDFETVSDIMLKEVEMMVQTPDQIKRR